MRFAAKRLTRSDLTLFETQFRRQNAGNQKSINLNRNVFVDLIFPGAPRLAGGQAARFPVQLRVFGPNGNPNAQSLTRKVIAAGGSQKNWRLNGETIHDPADEPGRYDNLQGGDIAVFGFEGDLVPDIIDLILVSQDVEGDASLYRQLDRLLGSGTRAMAILSDDNLADLIEVAPSGHPLADLADPDFDDDLEEAALGSAEAVRSLRRRSIRRQSAEELAAARLRASQVGRDGEVLVVGHLKRRLANGEIEDFVWESEVNAVNPWDITIRRRDGDDYRVEVKTTSGPHQRPFHISQAELEVAIEDGSPKTVIWRVSEIDGEGGVLRRSTNFRAFARMICDQVACFGTGIVPDGWTVNPGRLEWSEPRRLTFAEDPEE